MFGIIREILSRLVKTRIFILLIILIILFLFLVQHLFSLQIVHGKDYQENYAASIKKTISIDGVRGKIYDRNGELLAYNQLAYKVTLADTGSYETATEKNKALNAEIDRILSIIEANKDSVDNRCHIILNKKKGTVSFDVEGTALLRFRADVFGRAKIEDMKFNSRIGLDEATATAQQIYDYLLDRYGLSDQASQKAYSAERIYQIVVVRYGLSENSYQKYVTTTIASDVSDKTVAAIRENADTLEGVSVENTTRRIYTDPEYFSGLVGYVGKISSEEYNNYVESDDTYSLSDSVGKAGIEQVFESTLRGKKGEQTVYVNNVGKIQEVLESTQEGTGNDVYLSIDAKLQKAVYQLLEQEIAGVLLSTLRNTKDQSTKKDVFTSVYDVYTALFTNNVIDVDQMASAKKGTHQADVYSVFKKDRKKVYKKLRSALLSDKVYGDQSDEYQEYITYAVRMLQNTGIFSTDEITDTDQTFLMWKNEKLSARDYLTYAMEKDWIDIASLSLKQTYSDEEEVYEGLCDYMVEQLKADSDFDKRIYKYMIREDRVSPREVCLILYEQKLIKKDDDYNSLESGNLDTYSFVRRKMSELSITPGQLGLDPCTGSCVLMNPKDGSILACVSYPGYDTNKLSNSENSNYYNDLLSNNSLPLYNNAVQQATAPGSTYKMLTSITALTEGVITPETEILDEGTYENLGMNLHCWIYPGNHGEENLVEAIRDSCNYYFCEVGYRLSLKNENYSEKKGVQTLSSYAEAMGFGAKTGIEIPESKGKIATELPISAAIGQSNNAFTTIQLARYVSAVANEGTVYDLTLLDKTTDPNGKTVKTYKASVKNKVTDVSSSTWSEVKKGMRAAVEKHDEFNGIKKVDLAGKTGTAQESEKRPNHALFVGFAPYKNPKIAIATRIAHGYTSSNACDFAAQVMKYYFKLEKEEDLLSGKASSTMSNSNSIND